MNVRNLWRLGGVSLLVVGAVSGCGGKADTAVKPGNAVTVSTIHPEQHLFHQTVRVEGDVVSYDMPDVAAETQGKVLAVLVRPGDPVKKGQLLAKLDPADAATAVATARATLDHDNAVLADKKRILSRNQALASDDLIAKQVLTASEADALAAEADARSAQATLAQAGVLLGRTEVRAPFDATVTVRKAQPGMYASAGTALFTLASTTPATLQFKAPENLLPSLRPGMPVSVDIDGTTVRTTVRSVSPAIDATSRNFTFEATIPSGAVNIAPGHSLSGKVEVSQATGLSLPEKCVQSIGAEDFVFEARAGKAHRVAVKSGVHEDGYVQLGDSVAVASAYIADGANFVNEGQAIKVAGGKQ